MIEIVGKRRGEWDCVWGTVHADARDDLACEEINYVDLEVECVVVPQYVWNQLMDLEEAEGIIVDWLDMDEEG